MVGWVVVAEQDDTAAGIGEILARRVPGEWREGTFEGHAWYAFYCSAQGREKVVPTMAAGLAEFLLDVRARAWLRTILHRRYRGLPIDDEVAVLRAAQQELGASVPRQRDRMQRAAGLLERFLQEHDVVVVEGIRTFLLPDIRREWEEVVDHAVDEFLEEQEYREFVSLLRQFIASANRRWDLVHVCLNPLPFHFEDGAGQRVGDDVLSDLTDGRTVQNGIQDDLLVSALVTLAPQRVIVHRGPLRKEASRTIQAVFEGQVSFCQDCPRCHNELTDRRFSY
ncbi:MAG: putative sporulation protein YtxC [Thermaerobacter sp.]|nr:putative sporulation protein YtxC [Thermaerobacter sp.]